MYWEYLLIVMNQIPKVAIHRAGPALVDLDTNCVIFETGIKLVDALGRPIDGQGDIVIALLNIITTRCITISLTQSISNRNGT